MTLSEKQKAMADLQEEENSLLKKLTKITKMKPAKDGYAAISRAFKVVAISVRAAQIHSEKLILASQKTEICKPQT